MKPRHNHLGQPIGDPVSGDFPRPLPPRTPLQGRHCTVVPLDVEAHAAALFAAFAEDREGRIWTYLSQGPFPDLSGFRDWMHATCTGADPLFHTILDGEGTPAGLAAYLRLQPDSGVIEIGHICYAPRLQRSIAATEAQFLFMRRAFDELGYRRYEWKCDALNAPSVRAGQRLGFLYEGTFRQALVTRGRNRDTAWFSVLDREWPSIRAGFEAWLAPENFDATGQQRLPLRTRPGTMPIAFA